MTDLNVIALIPAKPGSEGVVRDALTELLGHTRQEAGCLKYELFESAATPGTFVTIEEWTDQAALDAHLASPHLAAALAAAGDALAAAPAIHPLKPA